METLPQSTISKMPFRKRLQWSEQAMIDAMKAVEDGMSVAKAAREHNVPRTTLQGRLSVHSIRPGQKCYLSHDEETKLADYITECALVGCRKTPEEIMTIAENTAHDKKEQLRKDSNTLGSYNNFMMRRQLLLREGTAPAPANTQLNAIMPDPVKHYFDLLDKTLQESNLKESFAQIYNLDEIGVTFEHHPKNVITLKSQKKFKCHTSGSKKQTTVVACVNTIGQAIPPFVIYNAKTLHPMWTKGGAPGTTYACSPKRWIDTELFKTWLQDHFLKFAVPGRPLLLITNSDKTLHELPIVEFAKEKDIFMLCLPTCTSQPLDSCALKKYWNDVAHNFLTKNPGRVIWKYNFPPLFRKAWEKAMTPGNICAGFEDAGIYPYNPDKLRPTFKIEPEEDNERGISYIKSINVNYFFELL